MKHKSYFFLLLQNCSDTADDITLPYDKSE